jgi:uncharacterized protein (DUF1800 family)
MVDDISTDYARRQDNENYAPRPQLSPALKVQSTMLNPLSPSDWTREHAAHLLRRAGFGSSPEELDHWHGLGLKKAVNTLIEWQDQPAYGKPPEWTSENSLKEFTDKMKEVRKLPEVERKEKRKELIRTRVRQSRELKSWWLDRMIHSPRPLEEKMTLFWHGHFVSSATKVKNGRLLWQQQELFRKLGNKNFQDLAVAIGRDPAMLIYLDGNDSKKSAPNENYARELMELFTLGEGHYTEEDIQEAARAFTGWKVRRLSEEANFYKFAHDDGRKQFLGQAGKFNDEDIVEIILQDPRCGQFIGAKLWKFFASDIPNEPMAAYIGRTLKQNNYEMAPVLERLFTSREFYSPDIIGKNIKSPADWLAGMVRSLPLHHFPEKLGPQILKQMGQDLFDPPSVKGWDGGRNWINTTTLLLRVNVAKMLVYGGKASELGIGGLRQIPDQVKENMTPMQIERMESATRNMGRRTIPSLVKWGELQNQWRELGSPEGRKNAARSLMGFNPGPKLLTTVENYFANHPIRSGSPPSQRHYQDMAYLVLSHPEYQLC